MILLAILFIIGVFIAALAGAIIGVVFSERYYQRLQDNKLYGTVFSGPPEPVGDETISDEMRQSMAVSTGTDPTDCGTPERGATPFRDSGRGRKVENVGWPGDMEKTQEIPVGWQDNHAAGDWPIAPTQEIKPLPGNLGGRQ